MPHFLIGWSAFGANTYKLLCEDACEISDTLSAQDRKEVVLSHVTNIINSFENTNNEMYITPSVFRSSGLRKLCHGSYFCVCCGRTNYLP